MCPRVVMMVTRAITVTIKELKQLVTNIDQVSFHGHTMGLNLPSSTIIVVTDVSTKHIAVITFDSTS